MWHELFRGIFETGETVMLSPMDFLLCVGVALLGGFIHAVCYMNKNTYSKSFVTTLATLPAIVCVVILMVNGNVGTGVAVAGVFSLVRFRSVPGTATEIGAIFIAMGAGLVFGMGYIGYGLLFIVMMSLVMLVVNNTRFGESKPSRNRTMTITVPEDLNYTSVFNDIMKRYTNSNKVVFVKTTNMGSLFKITYNLELIDIRDEKAFIDELRCRNGNLEISISPVQNNLDVL